MRKIKSLDNIGENEYNKNRKQENHKCGLLVKYVKTHLPSKLTDVFFNYLFAQNYNKYNQGKYTDSFGN